MFVVEYEDGCRYLGYTGRSVVRRLSELMAGPFVRGSDAFVREHGQRVPYLVYCVESGLDKRQAQQLRDRLVIRGSCRRLLAGATLTTSRCRLREGEPEAEVMSFRSGRKSSGLKPMGRIRSRKFRKGSIYGTGIRRETFYGNCACGRVFGDAWVFPAGFGCCRRDKKSRVRDADEATGPAGAGRGAPVLMEDVPAHAGSRQCGVIRGRVGESHEASEVFRGCGRVLAR